MARGYDVLRPPVASYPLTLHGGRTAHPLMMGAAPNPPHYGTTLFGGEHAHPLMMQNPFFAPPALQYVSMEGQRAGFVRNPCGNPIVPYNPEGVGHVGNEVHVCPLCGEPAAGYMGHLGDRAWFKCHACGWEWSKREVRSPRRNPWDYMTTSWTGRKCSVVSDPGDYGPAPHSELAMHTRIAGRPVIQYALWRRPDGSLNWAHVKVDDGTIVDGLPEEVLPHEVLRSLDWYGRHENPFFAPPALQYVSMEGRRQGYVVNPRAPQSPSEAAYRYEHRRARLAGLPHRFVGHGPEGLDWVEVERGSSAWAYPYAQAGYARPRRPLPNPTMFGADRPFDVAGSPFKNPAEDVEVEWPTCPGCGGDGRVIGQRSGSWWFNCTRCGREFMHRSRNPLTDDESESLMDSAARRFEVSTKARLSPARRAFFAGQGYGLLGPVAQYADEPYRTSALGIVNSQRMKEHLDAFTGAESEAAERMTRRGPSMQNPRARGAELCAWGQHDFDEVTLRCRRRGCVAKLEEPGQAFMFGGDPAAEAEARRREAASGQGEFFHGEQENPRRRGRKKKNPAKAKRWTRKGKVGWPKSYSRGTIPSSVEKNRHLRKMLASMKRFYGAKKGRQVFYATLRKTRFSPAVARIIPKAEPARGRKVKVSRARRARGRRKAA